MTDREQKIVNNMNLVHYIIHKYFPQYITNGTDKICCDS